MDYFLLRKTELDVDALYDPIGQYSYQNGWNWRAVLAFVLAVLPNIPGFLHAAFPGSFAQVGHVFEVLYTYAWFVGLGLSAVLYYAMMRGRVGR